jgi:glycosyltransferase involved in cell wall biosynthesis
LDELFLKARNLREINGQISSAVNQKLTVFIGIYEGEKYVSKIVKQLTSQVDQDFLIVAVDNNSQDSSWKKLQILLSLFPNRIILAKNPFNFGAAGSLALNIDLIRTDWWCAFHQDDEYKNNYVKNFNQLIQDVNEEAVSISAEMGSITNTGRKSAVPPRSSWLLEKPDFISSLIANLHAQTVPFPATAFKTIVYRECISPWHSTAFSDTESTLAMLQFGDFIFSKKNTMNYRENEMSESHSINSHESLLATGASLARIFSSSAFANMVKMVEPSDRVSFRKALNKSIEIRLGVSEFSNFVKYLAVENCMIAWDYSETSSIEQVRTYFDESGSVFTPQLLERILHFLDEKPKELADRSSLTNSFLSSFLESTDLNVNLKNQNLSLFRRLYNSLFKFLPFKMQKIVGTFALKLKIRVTKNHPWNFKWR